MLTPDYFYVIVGGGLAGLQLAAEISQDVFFKGKKIAVVEPSEKLQNDKTWCYWENGGAKWDDIVHHKWAYTYFNTPEISEKFDLGPYRYKMVRSIDFYEKIKDLLQDSPDVFFINDEIEKIDLVTRTAIGKNKTYTATHFFDSRLHEAYKTSDRTSLIYQHFKGLLIETEKAVFDPEAFTMMDYRISYQNKTCFTYVLPFSEKKALVEFTFFTPDMSGSEEYDELLEQYLRKVLLLKEWQVLETEKGVIPMTDYPFEKENSAYLTKIGTAGGWVKASSGYSFKNTEKKIQKLIENIKSGYHPGKDLINKKFRKFDAIFLDVLMRRNDLGKGLFQKLYTKNEITDIFRFLDEETTASENRKIMFSMYHREFLKSFFRKL
ncbi:MAG: lycopene cyclase family protein [Christiangramia sp.]|nr:lycopene cyclase [Christiangramia sp.]|tara:strand:+ start:327 stop:1463 length:1137 start_codon:yes stop_codon:yes gene_type:complete